MQLISCGVSGEVPQSQAKTWTQLDLDPFWVETIQVLNPNSQPRPVQIEALQKHRILESRRHLVIAAPTNSGKSLLGLLVLLESVRLHRRVVLIEPLRALAQEKTDEL
ncbi:MAG: DEAD/DEAH box helicase, partial [Snowella sp.]|nr:DEAD/DEAH box helicase [Snowella sp.]